MAEIWESAEFQKKLNRMPTDLRERFVRFVKLMYDRESDVMLKFLSESRQDMTSTARRIHEEQEGLRREASRAEASSRLSAPDRDAMVYSPSDSIFAEAVDSYLTENEVQPSSRGVSPTPQPIQPPVEEKIQEESAEIVQNMADADQKMEDEKTRQAEKVERMKDMLRERKEEREGLALELLNMARDIEERRRQTQEACNDKLRERLAAMRQKKQDK